MKEAIINKLKDIKSLPKMPIIVNRLLKLAYDPEVDIKALSDEIALDPAITAGIIKLSNTSFFSPANKIQSVRQAIMTLGLNTVKDIIVIIAARDILQVPMDSYKMGKRALWDHSLLVGDLASYIARLKKTKTRSDVAFTAGVLHDIGKIIIAEFFKKIQHEISREMEKNPTFSLSKLEKDYLGFTQNELGGKLLQIWKFPEELIESVSFVNNPEKAKINGELTSMVHVANQIALTTGIGIDIGGLNEGLSGHALKELKLTDSDLKTLYQSVPELCEKLVKLNVE